MSRPASLASRLRPELGRVAAGAVALAATNALGFAIPKLLQHAVDALGAGAPGALAVVGRASLIIVALAAAQALIRTASRILIFNTGRNVEYRLRGELFQRLTHRPPAFFQSHPTGDLMSRLTNDLGAVRALFGPALLNVINTLIVYTMGIWLLLSLNPRLTAFAILPFPLVILLGRRASRTVYTASRNLQEELGHLSTGLQEDLAGIAVVRAYALEPLRRHRFAGLNARYFERSLALARARGLWGPVFGIVGAVGTLVVLWLGGREVIAGRMSIGELVAFNAYLVYLSWPTVALGWVLSIWQRGAAAWQRVAPLLERDSDEHGGVAGRGAVLVDSSVETRALTIEREGRRVLDGVSLRIAPGQTLAIVGRTGSGKSTLADALLRFVDVPAGSVFVGGHDVRSLPPQTVRRAIGYAPQEPFLFSATVAENIAFGQHDDATPANGEEIRAAAETAGLARDIAALPDGYDTLVGERGITLSGGQRQRVALARAIYARPRVLVLDDSLSSVDAETERDILARLKPILKERTAVVISHRVAAVRDADEILMLEAGRVVERGRHGELMARGGEYASLYREQLRGEGELS